MIDYVKAHACGNDFLIIGERFADGRHSELARRICSRNTGVGADGVEFLNHRSIRLFNSDGSEAEISGNGTRCVAAWLAQTTGERDISLETAAGARRCRVVSAAGVHFEIASEMGVPTIATGACHCDGRDLEGTIVSVGNPHFVVFADADDFSCAGEDWKLLGKRISESKQFANGTNVEFVRILALDAIELRIYERGAGHTASSGTGSCAAAAAAIFVHSLSRMLRVRSPGGEQTVSWPTAASPMMLTGPADLVATGEAFL